MIEIHPDTGKAIIRNCFGLSHVIFTHHNGLKIIAQSSNLSNGKSHSLFRKLIPPGSNRNFKSIVPEVVIGQAWIRTYFLAFRWILPDSFVDNTSRSGLIYSHVILIESFRRSEVLLNKIAETATYLFLLYNGDAKINRTGRDEWENLEPIRNNLIQISRGDKQSISQLNTFFESACKIAKQFEQTFHINEKIQFLKNDIVQGKVQYQIDTSHHDFIYQVNALGQLFCSKELNPNMKFCIFNSYFDIDSEILLAHDSSLDKNSREQNAVADPDQNTVISKQINSNFILIKSPSHSGLETNKKSKLITTSKWLKQKFISKFVMATNKFSERKKPRR